MNLRPVRFVRSAFTLIELLVVIAIIAILAAILFPVFAKAREKARQAACASNLKQIATGFLMYSQDYDETLPPWTGDAFSTRGGAFAIQNMYYGLVDPYIKSGINVAANEIKDVWACPTAKADIEGFRTGYAYNILALGGFSAACLRDYNDTTSVCTRTPAAWAEFADRSYNAPAPLSSLQRPAETLMMADGSQLCRPPQWTINNPTGDPINVGIFGSHQPGEGKQITPASNSAPPGDIRRRFLAGFLTNVAYADGHVKAVNSQSLYHTSYSWDNGAFRGKATNNAGWARNWQ